MKEIKHNRPKYSLEFKQDAARLVLEKGYSQQQAAAHLGISLSALGRWVLAERKPSGAESMTEKPGLSLADQAELLRLRKENEQLRMEREILKKAAVFLRKKPNKVRVYSGATEDISGNRAVSCDGG